MKEFWDDRALLSQDDFLRSVLDPNDIKGIKNQYIDYYLKHYLKSFINANQEDRILEIGCGYGRLTEFMADYVSTIVGVDISENFVEIAQQNSKHANAKYISLQNFHKSHHPFNKAFMVWVAMYLKNDDDLISLLSTYTDSIKDGLILIEQIAATPTTQSIDGKFYAQYRTHSQLINILKASGFELVTYKLLNERLFGPFYRVLFSKYTYPFIPKFLKKYVGILFWCDRMCLQYLNINKIHKITDIAYEFKKIKNENTIST